MPNITPTKIADLLRAYEADFQASWRRMEEGQKVIDSTYRVLTYDIEDFEPYHSPVHRASLGKTVQRVVTYDPKIHIEPEGSSQKAKDVAAAMEKDSIRFMEGFTKALSRPPWSDCSWLIEARGKVAMKFGINPAFVEDPPKREEGEDAHEFARRTADYKRALTYGNPFTYQPVDTLRTIVHPPTLGVNPPWVIQKSRMDPYEVREKWPHWSDPKFKLSKDQREDVDIWEYCDKDVRGVLADEEEVTRIDRHSKGSIVHNEFRRVYYDILYSPYGQLPTYANSDGLTREQRMAVSQIDMLMENIKASDKVASFILLYIARYGVPLAYSHMTTKEYYRAVAEGHIKISKDDQIPGVVKQDPLPQYIDAFLAKLGQERDFATLPPVAVGLVTGGSSGVQQTQTLQQIDLQSITERQSIAFAMERAISECWYAIKYILPESTIGNVTKIRRDDIPDAPRIKIDMEPPDENRQARKLAMALSMKDYLPRKEILEASGREDTDDLEFRKDVDDVYHQPVIAETYAQAAIPIVQARLAEEEARQAAEAAQVRPPPTPEEAGVTPTEGMAGGEALPETPEDMALQQDQALMMPQGV